MTRDEALKRAEVMSAYANGATVEIKHLTDSNWWYVDEKPEFHPNRNYRVALTKDSIDWSHVDGKWNNMVRQANGEAYLYSVSPVCDEPSGGWRGNGSSCIPADCFASYKRGNCDWKDSLVTRPENGDE